MALTILRVMDMVDMVDTVDTVDTTIPGPIITQVGGDQDHRLYLHHKGPVGDEIYRLRHLLSRPHTHRRQHTVHHHPSRTRIITKIRAIINARGEAEVDTDV